MAETSVAVRTPTLSLSESEWMPRRAAHETRVRLWLEAHQTRQARGEKHPVYDFLFDYYAFRPGWLRRWHPGVGVALAGRSAHEFLRWREYQETAEGICAQPAQLKPARRESIAWIRKLLISVSQRPTFFGCFGLHEWALVFRQTLAEIRHREWPLRHSSETIAQVVENLPICCSHFDAFRFFSSASTSLNRIQPTRASVTLNEQGGCLHANMDLYKWAFKMAPFTPSELVADCFELAREIREVDMRASPYDLRTLGFEPIAIEKPEGRGEYERLQRDFAARAQPLRARLIQVCDAILAEPTNEGPEAKAIAACDLR